MRSIPRICAAGGIAKTALFCSDHCPGGPVLNSGDPARALPAAPATPVGRFPVPHRKAVPRTSAAPAPAPTRPFSFRPPFRHRPPRPPPRRHAHSPTPGATPSPPAASCSYSTFADTIRRPTAATAAARRNACVAALAHRIPVPHAAPGAKTAALCQQALAAAKPVYTLPSPHNAHLIALGAQPLSPPDPAALLAA